MIKVFTWSNESVVFCKESGDIFLLSSFNAEILTLINNNINDHQILSKIIKAFRVNRHDAQIFLDNLYLEYKSLNLID